MTKTALRAVGGLVAALVVGVGIWSAIQPVQAPSALPTDESIRTPIEAPPPSTQTATIVPFQAQTFTQTKAAHFVSSEPANNTVLTAPPTSVKINFNFDLAPPSKITVTRDGMDVASGQTTIAADKLSMSVPINAQQTGNYQVNYTACWPDKSCHNGSFGFSVQVQ